MPSSVLQEFLNLRLLDIGAEDSRLEKLNEAADELAQSFVNTPKDAVAPLLAAWDPSAGADPALTAIGVVLQSHWPTFRGAFPDEPLTLYRAIVLEAVARAMEQQTVLAIAVNFIGGNVLPHLNVGQEERILSNLMGQAKAVADRRLAEVWPPHSQNDPVAPFELPALPAPKKTDANAWFPQVAAAAGPSTNKAGVSLNAPNPHWTNQPQHWSWEFADRMAPLLAELQDMATAAAVKISAGALKSLGNAIGAKINDFLGTEQARSNHLQNSSRLLWWRQALYSETADSPYRKLHPAVAALHMAYDLAELLPVVYPPAVESLLFEAVKAATGARAEEEVAIGELLEAQRQHTQGNDSPWLAEQQTPAGSRSLLVQALANSTAAKKTELPKLGIDPDTKLSLADWAIWLLREVKALDSLSSLDAVNSSKEQA